MVKVTRSKVKDARDYRSPTWKAYLPAAACLICLILLLSFLVGGDELPTPASKTATGNAPPPNQSNRKAEEDSNTNKKKQHVTTQKEAHHMGDGHNRYQCHYSSIDDLLPEELHPVQGSRHMVTPPSGGPLSLVCCMTTKGSFNALVHEKWAPLGAQRFLDMVKHSYFEYKVPLFRCIKNFICQFGINSDPHLSKKFRPAINDDPNWLPEGKEHRKNDKGVARFARGYLAYAGGGRDSRSNQFIISLQDDETLAGGSPYEVPWGELVGKHSFDTWSKIYTEYGEYGPPQGKLMNQGMSSAMENEFPDMDSVTGCQVVDERTEELS